jgi:lipopolysaccharide export LptBFGC system permease protein LptF
MEKTFDLYLSLNTKSPRVFREDETTFEQRAAAIFNSYIKQLLIIAAQEKEILNDEVVTGIMVNNRWQIETILNPQYQSVSFEQLTFVAPKKEINDYVNHLITDQELLDRSILIALQNGETPRMITLSLEGAQVS